MNIHHRLSPFLNGLFLLFLIISSSPIRCAWAEERILPFSPGERLTFQLKWGIIPAGEAVLEVLPTSVVDGKPAHHFSLTVNTYPLLDVIYKVRDHIDSYVDLDMTRSLLYKKKQHEGSTQRDIVVRFDWDKNEATYSNFNVAKPPVSIQPGSFDPLSIFYHARVRDLKLNTTIECPVTDGTKSVMGQAAITKREILEINGVVYDTILIEPELKDIGGVFKKSKNAKIELWLTVDERRIPVRIRSKVAVGSFTGDLMTATGNWPSTVSHPKQE